MSKQGVKRGSAQHANILATKEMMKQAQLDAARSVGMIHQMDVFLLALGRMGHRKAFIQKLNEKIMEVNTDFVHMWEDDHTDDPEIWHTKGMLDRELQQYYGDLFLPWDDRFDIRWYTIGLRINADEWKKYCETHKNRK